MESLPQQTLVILRGCSGAGKSTLAAELLQSNPTALVFSTDDFFRQNESGEYKHDPSRLSEAHAWNQARAAAAMASKAPVVVIDNTNLQRWEAKPYVECALKEGYSVVVKEPTTDWWVRKDVNELFKRGTHGVPYEAIAKMVERYEPDFSVEAIMQSSPPDFSRSRRGGFNNGGRGSFNRGGFNGNRGNFNNNRGGHSFNNNQTPPQTPPVGANVQLNNSTGGIN
ncbi:NEDD4-binding protein 2 [Rhizoclosmatium sp. JEL0117]|nr:NEDD4-binding protein 2 [Rhizoclosmatium sp. JEL0117]